MGTLFSSLDVSTAGLQVTQVSLDVTSHNIANVNKEGFSRQRVDYTSRIPINTIYGQIPRGPAVGNMGRIRDPLLDQAFRRNVPDLGASELRARYYSQLEATFIEPTATGFGTRINAFFDAFNDFSSNVELIPAREAAVAESVAVAEGFKETADRLFAIRTAVNNEITNNVQQINSIAEQVARLNDRIRPLEAGTREASDLRDDRDLLIDQLAKLVDVRVAEDNVGQVSLIISGEQLVAGTRFRQLEAVVNPSLDTERADLVEVRFADSGSLYTPLGGELAAALDFRDNVLVAADAELDELASEFILAMNRIHTSGHGLVNLTTATSGNAVDDATVALNAAGLGFPVTAGSFDIVVYDDATQTPVTTTIAVGAGTSLNDIATALNGVGNVTASVTDGQLTVSAAAGFSFTFANDTSDALAALSLNGLFTGNDAFTMGVNQQIVDNPELLTSSFDPDLAATGENDAALAMADVQNALLYANGTANINAYYERIITEVGVDARANLNQLDVDLAFVDDFERRRQEVSGVNLDEEVTNLVIFQRAYEANARVLSTVNEMLDTLINGTR